MKKADNIYWSASNHCYARSSQKDIHWRQSINRRRKCSSAIRLLLLILIALFVFVSGCTSSPETGQPTTSLEGFWEFRSEPETILFEFKPAGDGSFKCLTHNIRNECKTLEMPIESVEVSDDRIKLSTKITGFSYHGQIDLENGVIRGEVNNPGGAAFEMDLLSTSVSHYPSVNPLPHDRFVSGEYICTQPVQRDDQWQTSSLAASNIDPGTVSQAIKQLCEAEFGLLHSLLIVRDSNLVFEEYFHGYKADTPHRLASDTKSISSLLIGIAIDKGYLGSVDNLVSDFFPSYRDLCSPAWEKITLRHILTMTAGLNWTPEVEASFHNQDNFIATVLKTESKLEPGTKFEYKNPDMAVLAGVIKESTGKHADIFAQEHLFGPLGISIYNWDYLKQNGFPLMDGSLHMCPRDMAKIGQLVLDEGRWAGEQIISKSWITESTSANINTGGPEDYGYLWWRSSVPMNNQMIDVIFASGWGSQFIVVIPSAKMVIVCTGGNDSNGKNFAPFKLLTDYLIPAIE